MASTQTARRSTPPTFRSNADWAAPPQPESPVPDSEIGATPSDQGLSAMRVAFRSTGGTARGDDLARLLEDRRLGDFVSLARLIVSRKLFGFVWRDTVWVPMFQFELRDLTIRPGPQQVLAELAAVFDDWSIAAWFARPNAWLDDRKPVDLLDLDLPAVLNAARADRFIVAG